MAGSHEQMFLGLSLIKLNPFRTKHKYCLTLWGILVWSACCGLFLSALLTLLYLASWVCTDVIGWDALIECDRRLGEGGA